MTIIKFYDIRRESDVMVVRIKTVNKDCIERVEAIRAGKILQQYKKAKDPEVKARSLDISRN